jgi:hypothetical protein
MSIINEDFEREFLKDTMYLIEHQKEIEEEWRQFEEENNRLPAKIEIVIPNIIKQN